ncbi:hypothetical protein JAAARDRAFT_190382 [Jaapia argillacea MUCL 33604]|uniref:Uncharacterized protein n=1 Tax=Jaapia argillacea MUCL 33604 TaxID=933084 RepID=A0A067QDR9_9AGAM|nr:hypothetical protein JAAARDRAFT_190382 [Jaapia argillacea MUCL 33604]
MKKSGGKDTITDEDEPQDEGKVDMGVRDVSIKLSWESDDHQLSWKLVNIIIKVLEQTVHCSHV